MKQSIRVGTVLCLAAIGLATTSAAARADACDDAVYAAKDFVLQSMRQGANRIADHLVSSNARIIATTFRNRPKMPRPL
jgi:hypothetical protein